MKNWIRMTLISSLLVGGTVFFAYQSFSEFNKTLNTMSAAYVAIANIPSISFDKENKGQISTTTPEGVSTTTPEGVSTTTTQKIVSTVATSTDAKLSFVFPKKNSEVYIGCTYQIPLLASTTIRSLGTALIDAGTGETIGPIASGLAKENTIEKDSQNLKWKVGVIWPGAYYIKASKINGIDVEIKSKVFEINKMPADISTDEKKSTCKESGGLL